MGIDDIRARLLAAIDVHRSGNYEDAVKRYREVLAIAPDHFDGLRLLGAACGSLGRDEEAVAAFDAAIRRKSDSAEVWALRGDALARLRRPADAAHSYERALVCQPNTPAVWLGHAVQLLELGRPETALASAERATALQADHVEAWQCHATALHALGRHEQMLASADRALELRPASAEMWNLRAEALRAQNRRVEALESCQRALSFAPGFQAAHTQRGILLAELGRFDEALPILELAVSQAPEDAQAQFNLGLLNLTAGRLQPGWEGYEWRKKVPQFQMPAGPPGAAWEPGQTLAGRVLLVNCEQGLGDSIQFYRYMRLLAARAAGVIFAVQPSLASLMRMQDSGAAIVTDGDPMPAYDRKCSLLSVPRLIGTRLDSIPAPTPYLIVAPELRAHWERRLGPRARRRIALVCSGNPDHGNDANRSIALREFAALGALDADIHLAQKDLRAVDEPWLHALGIFDHRAELRDFSDTAALLSGMDAVVSVDTAVAHLAGALGRDLRLILPENPDWRWMLEREDSPWYPTARLFRRPRAGSWPEVIARVVESLTSS